MRRRRLRAAGSTAVSLALHGAVLAAAVHYGLAPRQLPGVIRVTLRPPGGGGGAGALTAAAAEPEPAMAAPVAVPPKPSLRPARRASHAPMAAPVPPSGARPRRAPDTAASVAEANADTAGSGPGNGGGSGGGQGEGAGIGRGAGNGDDRRPYCVYCPEPDYPLIARRRGWQGTVDIELLLLADGHVERASIRQTSGHDVLDRAAVAVAEQSRFTPQGRDLAGRIEYRFELVAAR